MQIGVPHQGGVTDQSHRNSKLLHCRNFFSKMNIQSRLTVRNKGKVVYLTAALAHFIKLRGYCLHYILRVIEIGSFIPHIQGTAQLAVYTRVRTYFWGNIIYSKTSSQSPGRNGSKYSFHTLSITYSEFLSNNSNSSLMYSYLLRIPSATRIPLAQAAVMPRLVPAPSPAK